jgi:hypothetical protein
MARVDPGLAAHRAVDLRQKRGRHLHEAHAPAQDRGGETHQIADHPAAERDTTSRRSTFCDRNHSTVRSDAPSFSSPRRAAGPAPRTRFHRRPDRPAAFPGADRPRCVRSRSMCAVAAADRRSRARGRQQTRRDAHHVATRAQRDLDVMGRSHAHAPASATAPASCRRESTARGLRVIDQSASTWTRSGASA